MNKNIWAVVFIVIIIILGGGLWYYETQFIQTNQSVPVSVNQTSQQTKTATSAVASKKVSYKAISWVDPKNTIYGFHFDVPDSWIEQPYGNERSIEVHSCSDTTAGCDADSMIILHIDVNPPNTGDTLVIPDYTKQGEVILSSSTIAVGGVSGQAVVGQFQNQNGLGKQPGNSITAYLLFQRDNVQYLGTISGNQALEQQTKPIVSEILSSFAFEAPQAQNPPAEYQSIEKLSGNWTLTYQDGKTKDIVCSDGNTGTMPQGYVFTMSASPADQNVDTPYTNVVSVLENSGWTQCNSSNAVPQAPSAVFLKNNRLIEVSRYYSNGVGNSLIVQIQY